MIKRTVKQIADMLGTPSVDKQEQQRLIQGVSIDTRTLKPHNLFIPIKGERANGHDFVADAFAKGAAATLWQKDEPNPPTDKPVLLVEDTLAALQHLAKAYRQQLSVKVVGITGSNGKTSTKDILAGILSTTFPTQKTVGNLNNHLGVPLTLLSLEEETEIAVVEMGMSALGEIKQLAEMADLDAAIITNASEVHLGDLKSRERIVQAKLEIRHGLKKNGFLAYNGDNPQLCKELNKLSLPVHKLSFGELSNNTCYPLQIKVEESGVSFTMSDPECPPLFLPLLGKHQVINTLGAISVARYLGVSYKQIKQGLEQIEVTGMRTELVYSDKQTIINDCYKSNPTSLRAALQTLYALKAYQRKIVVLGDMVELGEEATVMHQEIGAELDPRQIDMVFTLGSMATHIAQVAQPRFPNGHVFSYLDKKELITTLIEVLRDDSCLILVKGSRSLRLEEVVNAIQNKAVLL